MDVDKEVDDDEVVGVTGIVGRVSLGNVGDSADLNESPSEQGVIGVTGECKSVSSS